mmetsp:Transcript_10446/g.14312  ORF Transcript_10446/g.14312 Transcript_10446/m.14312 type:complete len:262 (+) Transcript_10446:2414-3199(+)
MEQKTFFIKVGSRSLTFGRITISGRRLSLIQSPSCAKRCTVAMSERKWKNSRSSLNENKTHLSLLRMMPCSGCSPSLHSTWSTWVLLMTLFAVLCTRCAVSPLWMMNKPECCCNCWRILPEPMKCWMQVLQQGINQALPLIFGSRKGTCTCLLVCQRTERIQNLKENDCFMTSLKKRTTPKSQCEKSENRSKRNGSCILEVKSKKLKTLPLNIEMITQSRHLRVTTKVFYVSLFLPTLWSVEVAMEQSSCGTAYLASVFIP